MPQRRRSNMGRHSAQWYDRRQEMIDETNRFLEWAFLHSDQVPQIPRRRADQGGFAQILTHRGARALVNHWWKRWLE